jgi:UDP-3-O-[3-hydroxymyristoyl] N-acetylglucosamine deacetylase
MNCQRTLSSTIGCAGTGLHSGKEVRLTLRPASENKGIVFVRTDLPEPVEIKVEMRSVSASNFATTLESRGVSVGTVEHLLAALSGLGVDNAMVEVDAPEVPIMDGSAAPFVALIRRAGVADQSQPRNNLIVKKAVHITEGERWIELSPSENLQVSCTVDFDHPTISNQFYQVCLPGRAFEEEVAPARTFGFLSDVAQLRSMGYALGGSLQNAIVIDDFGVLNEEGLRFPDEFARHKILDLVGDFSLLGHPIVCRVKAHKSGHAMTHRLLRELLSRKDCWELMEPQERESEGVLPLSIPLGETRGRVTV